MQPSILENKTVKPGLQIIQKSGYTILGKYSCSFFETAIEVCKEAILMDKKLIHKVVALHETPFENKINELKGLLPDSEIQLHKSNESPCVFYDSKYIGSLDDFTSHLMAKFNVKIQKNVQDAIPNAERRKIEQMNTSKSDFFRICFEIDDEVGPGHCIVIELFPHLLPKSCHRFMKLGEGKVDAQQGKGYIGTRISRVQKDSFLQFGGGIPNIEQEFDLLEDEGFMIHHTEPGIVGFVGGPTKHSNRSEFYITLDRMKAFDKKYVAFGRVIEGMDLLRRFNQEQSFDLLTPELKVVILSCDLYVKKPSEKYLRKIRERAVRKTDCEKELRFFSYDELYKYCKDFDPIALNNGSESLELRNIKAADDLTILNHIKMFNFTRIVLRNCEINKKQLRSLFGAKLFYKVTSWEFDECTNFDKEVIDILFNNETTSIPATELHFTALQEGNTIFQHFLASPNLTQLQSLSFKKGDLNNESLELLQSHAMRATLKSLSLSDNFFVGEDQKVTDFLAQLETPLLQTLNLNNCYLSVASIKAVIANKHFKGLKSLDLSNNRNIDSALLQLSKSATLKSLEELYISNTGLQPATLFELVSSVNFSNIKKFDIGFNFALGDDLAAVMDDRPFIRYVEYLGVSRCDLTSEGLKYLCKNRFLGNLKDLDISKNPKTALQGILDEWEDFEMLANLNQVIAHECGASSQELAQLNDELSTNFVNLSPGVIAFQELIQHLTQDIPGLNEEELAEKMKRLEEEEAKRLEAEAAEAEAANSGAA